MEVQLWPRLYRVMADVSKVSHRTRGVQMSDRLIVQTYVWSVLHDRPTGWACDAENWPAAERWRQLPSPSTMSRRLRTVGVRQLLERVQEMVNSWFPRSLCFWVDSKPLPVGGASKDPDVKIGRGAGMRAKGYRLHALFNAAASTAVAWLLAPMNDNDALVARRLFERAAGAGLSGYAAADNQYDANQLYDLAATAGLQLVTPRRAGVHGLGHVRQSPHRLRGIDLAARGFGQNLLHARGGIERAFGTLGNFAGGLGPLPNWVRRPHRVAMWVAGKLLIDSIRRALKQRLIA